MSILPDVEVLQPRPGAVVVECRGEHDLTTSESLARLLTELVATNDLVVIDISEAEFIDSSFLHNLVKADRLARPRGTRVRLQFGTAPIVARALEVSGILMRIEHASTREEALGSRES
jgi:anti-anti-sigma factor